MDRTQYGVPAFSLLHGLVSPTKGAIVGKAPPSIEQELEFRDFMTGCQSRILRLAELLTHDRGHAEDLAQHGFAKAFMIWDRLRAGDPEGYVRRCVANAHIDRWRRGNWREQPKAVVVDARSTDDFAVLHAERETVLAALAKLTSRERTVVVLRYYCDLPEADIARELGIRGGTVKSTAARALMKLRQDADLHQEAAR